MVETYIGCLISLCIFAYNKTYLKHKTMMKQKNGVIWFDGSLPSGWLMSFWQREMELPIINLHFSSNYILLNHIRIQYWFLSTIYFVGCIFQFLGTTLVSFKENVPTSSTLQALNYSIRKNSTGFWLFQELNLTTPSVNPLFGFQFNVSKISTVFEFLAHLLIYH